MTITIPDEIADVLGASAAEREQRAREALALDLYRDGKISLRRPLKRCPTYSPQRSARK